MYWIVLAKQYGLWIHNELRENIRAWQVNIKHLVYMPIGHVVLKIYVPCKTFDVLSQYLCKATTSPLNLRYTGEKKVHAQTEKSLAQLGT